MSENNSKYQQVIKKWTDLNWLAKVALGLFIVVAASFAPELMILMDVGGVEVAASFLILYFKPIGMWLLAKKQQLFDELSFVVAYLQTRALAKPNVLLVNTVYCCLFVAVTGFAWSGFGFFIPAMVISGA